MLYIIVLGANSLAGVPVTSVTIPSGVEEIGAGAFNATALTSLFVPASVTVIGENIVINCENLADLSVAADNPSFMSKNNMIFNKEGDTLLMCSPWLEGEVVISEGTERLGQSCCDTMKKMTRLILPTTLVELGWGSVSRCDALETVVINSDITLIPQSVFAYCTSLKEINIPDTVTEIELAAFSNCISLKNITFPKSLTTIGNGAFMYCDLEEVELPDGDELENGTDYTVRKSSTVVTLKPALLESVSAGEHLITVVFDNGSIEIPLAVAEQNPPTGDSANNSLWLVLASLCCGAVFITVVAGRKKLFCRG